MSLNTNTSQCNKYTELLTEFTAHLIILAALNKLHNKRSKKTRLLVSQIGNYYLFLSKAWYQEAEKGSWQNFNELKQEYPSASVLEGGRVCFNIKGNNYRLIVKINFNFQIMWIRFIGTHAAYDKIDANKI